MRITSVGFLTDHKSRVLLREAARWEPVTAPVRPGEWPADVLAEAFRRETGLIVLPVRLVGVYYDKRGGGELALTFRCTMRGGELKGADEQPRAGFFDAQHLPPNLGAAHRQQLADALHHEGGPAVLARSPTDFLERWRRLRRRPAPLEQTDWEIEVCLMAHAGDGQYLWTRAADSAPWRLPVEPARSDEAPWDTATRLWRTLGNGGPGRLAVLEVAAAQPLLRFCFAGHAIREPVGARNFFVAAPEAGFAPADVVLVRAAEAGGGTLVRRRPPENQPAEP